VRKLADVALPTDYTCPLYRAVRGELPASFWLPDVDGHVRATELSFMSTSRTVDVAMAYMSETSANVLWEVQPAPPSAEGFHFGADVSMLSQFASESEILFPPFTMLQVHERRTDRKRELAVAQMFQHGARRSRAARASQASERTSIYSQGEASPRNSVVALPGSHPVDSVVMARNAFMLEVRAQFEAVYIRKGGIDSGGACAHPEVAEQPSAAEHDYLRVMVTPTFI